MIFLTVGTHEPFDRLVRAMDAWCARQQASGHTLFGQIAERRPGDYIPKHFEWTPRLAPAEYAARFAEADLIVSHAGMGSILTALQSAKPIVILPRRAHLHETRNDHQFSTVKMLGSRPGIYVADNEVVLPSIIDQAIADLDGSPSERISLVAQSSFTDALREFLTKGQS